ncbi:PEP-utilizing enzyme [uncultured Thiothrix sp.]|uniref:PEP-utilizing enzyme n=1 Tax=uncultured Thiothrix sp. TaxID=223185 RepID=UPI00261EB18B|nr:PEP-utilizing enzyme [uncultured Thiothrix sp.]HMT94577.1 PEP-utilizing enzyme [Thiolinea sp.]
MTKLDNIYVALSTELPAKYQRLIESAEAGLQTPRSLLLTDPTTEIESFLASFPNASQFIVRSANKTEDGSGHSLAGHFWSSAAVSREQVSATIQTAWLENQRLLTQLGLEQTPLLMLQEYIQHEIGGVLFMPWSFFSEYAYVEYSTGGVQQVVAGQAHAVLIGLEANQPNPLALPSELSFLELPLRALAKRLATTFNFPIDCEWAYSSLEQQIIVLQVRAQTHAMGSFCALPENLEPPSNNWQFTALSESLGKLSPLSFSLLKQLYQESIPALQRLGFKAIQVDFLAYQSDGTVLVDTKREQLFYASSLMGGFWRGFRSAEFKNKAETVLANFDPDAAFDYQRLASLFTAWLIQTILQVGEGRELVPPMHAYELSWINLAEHLSLDHSAPLNLKLRSIFLLELNKLKQQLLGKKALVFCDWGEYQKQDFSQALMRQYQAVGLAIYDYALSHTNSEFQSLASPTVVTGTVLKVAPHSSQALALPKQCIWLSTYFDNRWVHLIPKLKGIIVLQGNRLAHSALVAREYGIPYVVVSLEQFSKLSSGLMIELDARQGQIRVLKASPSTSG